MRELYQIVHDCIDSQGKDQQGKTLGKYFTHGLGQNVGLDVHDPPEKLDLKIEEGMVLTIEPGIYIPEESIWRPFRFGKRMVFRNVRSRKR